MTLWLRVESTNHYIVVLPHKTRSLYFIRSQDYGRSLLLTSSLLGCPGDRWLSSLQDVVDGVPHAWLETCEGVLLRRIGAKVHVDGRPAFRHRLEEEASELNTFHLGPSHGDAVCCVVCHCQLSFETITWGGGRGGGGKERGFTSNFVFLSFIPKEIL